MSKVSMDKKLEAVYLAAAGLTNTEIARKLGISREAVRVWRKQDWWRKYLTTSLAKELEKARNKLFSASNRAVERLIELIEHDNPWVALNAIQQLLTHTLGRVTEAEDLERLLAALTPKEDRPVLLSEWFEVRPISEAELEKIRSATDQTILPHSGDVSPSALPSPARPESTP